MSTIQDDFVYDQKTLTDKLIGIEEDLFEMKTILMELRADIDSLFLELSKDKYEI